MSMITTKHGTQIFYKVFSAFAHAQSAIDHLE